MTPNTMLSDIQLKAGYTSILMNNNINNNNEVNNSIPSSLPYAQQVHQVQALFSANTTYMGSPPPNMPFAGEMSLALGAVQPPGTL